MDPGGVRDRVVVTLGLKVEVIPKVRDLDDPVGIQHPLAIDDGPEGDDIADLQSGRVADRPVDDQVALGEHREHGVRLDGEGAQTQHAGYAAAGLGGVGGITGQNGEQDGKDQYNGDDDVDNAVGLFFHFRARGLVGCFHVVSSVPK